MSPIDIPPYDDPQVTLHSMARSNPTENGNYGWLICQTTLNMIGRLCIGIVVGICLAFAFRNGVPLNVTNQHIVLCVIGVSTLFFFFSK